MTCNVCGKKINPKALFCSACGNKIEKTIKTSSRLVWLIIVLLLMLAADFVFFYAVSIA